eukprot:TRINITY_DN6090_c0_g1_i4.p1 TRINITY_DN6090_c0_g1~~TRINITY_DN6090_c0_g1_i4.p1  ORF type:complete len:413 (-),score=50.94 TRINITY_DN6090_c0_g1_i4:270-1508(-)
MRLASFTFVLCALCVIHTTRADWLSDSLLFQRELTKEHPLNEHIMIGTHNSFSWYDSSVSTFPPADTYNQKISMSSQLNLGVRMLNLDLHWITNFTNALRICHGSSEVYTACNQNNWQTCNVVGIPRYSPEDVGCFPFDKTAQESFTEINNWLNSNPSEVIIVDFDNQVATSERAAASTALNIVLQNTLGSKIYTPSDLSAFRGGSSGILWPSVQQLRSASKQVILSCRDYQFDVNGNYVHGSLQTSPQFTWPVTQIKNFVSSSCSSSASGASVPIPNNFNWWEEDDTVIDLGGAGGLVHNGPVEAGYFTEDSTRNALGCGHTVRLDRVNASKMSWTVWSWDTDQPSAATVTTKKCVLVNRLTGRWSNENCACSTCGKFGCRSTSLVRQQRVDIDERLERRRELQFHRSLLR